MLKIPLNRLTLSTTIVCVFLLGGFTGCWDLSWCGGSEDDMDHDGSPVGADCNDNNSTVYPGADEVPYNGTDENCDGKDLVDVDEDGYAGGPGGTDCDDQSAAINPGATEKCDGLDNDCDGFIDEGFENDIDDDGDGYTENEGDCNDGDAGISPDVDEVPYDGIDQDCDGKDLVDVDEDGEDAVFAGGIDCNDNDSDVTHKSEVYIPGGLFWMGSPADDPNTNADERPIHEVYVSGYCIDRYEVSNALYSECMNGDGCTQPPTADTSAGGQKYYGTPLYTDYPVLYVTWNMAQGYCEQYGKHLPTEAQWEKAARGGICLDGDDISPCPGTAENQIADRAYPWGSDLPDCTRANFKYEAELDGECTEQPIGDTVTVKSYPSKAPKDLTEQDFVDYGLSPYGVYNMAGNVSEWVWDYYSSSYYNSSSDSGDSIPQDPTGPDSGNERTRRGGDFDSEGIDIRASTRRSDYPEYSYFQVGFRCARSLFTPELVMPTPTPIPDPTPGPTPAETPSP